MILMRDPVTAAVCHLHQCLYDPDERPCKSGCPPLSPMSMILMRDPVTAAVCHLHQCLYDPDERPCNSGFPPPSPMCMILMRDPVTAAVRHLHQCLCCNLHHCPVLAKSMICILISALVLLESPTNYDLFIIFIIVQLHSVFYLHHCSARLWSV